MQYTDIVDISRVWYEAESTPFCADINIDVWRRERDVE